MSVRVHKMVGYGIYGIKKGDGWFDWDKFEDSYEKDLDRDSFIIWVDNNKKVIEELWDRRDLGRSFDKEVEFWKLSFKDNNWDLYKSVVWKGSDEVPVMLFIPPEYSGSWYRFDNAVDFIEETEEWGQKDRVKFISNLEGGSFIRVGDSKMGELVNNYVDAFCRDKVIRDEKGFPKRFSSCDFNYLLENAKIDFKEHLQQDWRMEVPFSVVGILLWLGCVKDMKKFIDSLRPMIYVCWF